jgi:hypothetical protein
MATAAAIRRPLSLNDVDHLDELDAVGLGRYRDTDDWCTPVTG